jgi:hypothetical protein
VVNADRRLFLDNFDFGPVFADIFSFPKLWPNRPRTLTRRDEKPGLARRNLTSHDREDNFTGEGDSGPSSFERAEDGRHRR